MKKIQRIVLTLVLSCFIMGCTEKAEGNANTVSIKETVSEEESILADEIKMLALPEQETVTENVADIPKTEVFIMVMRCRIPVI